MPKPTCTVEGCEAAAYRREMCNKHYIRVKRHGNPHQTARRAAGPCKVSGCSTEGDGGHGYCAMHYRRWQRHGDHTTTSRIVGDDVARFESYLSEQPAPAHAAGLGPCWAWTGLKTRDGYAVMASDLPTSSAHRWSYRHHVGPLLDGLELDHLCRVRHCVNPWHLDQVTHEENLRRAREASNADDVEHAASPRPAA